MQSDAKKKYPPSTHPKSILVLDLSFSDISTEMLGIRIVCLFVNLSALLHMIRVLMKFGLKCKTIFSLFQAGFFHPCGNRTGSGYAETAMITVGVKFDL